MERKKLAQSIGVTTSTLSKWLDVYGEVTGQLQARDISLEVAGHIAAAANRREEHRMTGDPITFRAALSAELGLVQAVSAQQATTLTGLLREHLEDSEKFQARVERSLMRLEDEFLATRQAMENVEARLIKLERESKNSLKTEDVEALKAGAAAARLGLARIVHGFEFIQTAEGHVLAPRRSSGPVVEVEAEEQPGLLGRAKGLLGLG